MKNRVSSVTQGSGLSVHSCAARQGEAAKILFFIAEKRCKEFSNGQLELKPVLSLLKEELWELLHGTSLYGLVTPHLPRLQRAVLPRSKPQSAGL
jgi:hypothetical protein